jgi:membrane fusion protein (multidrug efflux system)
MAVGLKQLGLGAAAVAVIAAAGAYWRYDSYGRYFEDTNDATFQADQVAIATKLAGYVKAVSVADNQQVAAGAPLVDIDPIDYQTRLAAAQADIGSARATVAAARAHSAEGGAGVAAAEAALLAAEADLDHATGEVARYRPLATAGAEPAEKLAALVTTQKRATADVAGKRAALSQARLRITTLGAQAQQASARVDAALVAADAAGHDLAFTHLVAPLAGRVASRSVRVGQFVQPGTRLMTIVPDTGIYVLANFKETQVGLMRAGQPAEIVVDALSGVTFHGTVDSVTPGTGANFSLIPPQNATGNFTKIIQRVPVRIRIDAGPEAKKVLVPGLSLVVTVDTRSAKDALAAIRAEASHER